MQAYHFHIDQPGDYRAVFQLSAKARETAEITHIVLADRLAGLPDEAIKSAQVLGQGATARLERTSAGAQTARRDDLERLAAARSASANSRPGGPVQDGPRLGEGRLLADRAFVGISPYALGKQAFAPLDFVNTQSGEVFPAEKIIAGEPWPGKYGDDGTGIFFARSDFPKLPSDIYYCPRAELLGQRLPGLRRRPWPITKDTPSRRRPTSRKAIRTTDTTRPWPWSAWPMIGRHFR